ncbi:MAG TPA: class I lanthipeptide, partial [Polyangia bacterium]|nr:class I lanthipeptide [Polyangia bacterium]
MHRQSRAPKHPKRLQRKLSLNKETLTCLSSKQLVKVAGGDDVLYPTCPCTMSCTDIGCGTDV